MSHPYKAFTAEQHGTVTGNGNGADHPLTVQANRERRIHLSPVEEHYLKKSLIKNELISELNSLSPDYSDISGLRRFGPPFVPADPQNFLKNPDSSTLDQIYAISEANIDIFRNQFPLLRFIFDNYFATFPFIKIHLDKLGPSPKDQSKFWLKIQILFELFKGKKISNSNDRGTTSKRKLLLYKFQNLFMILYNSSIYCSQDPQYFEMDKERRGAYKKLGKFIDTAESENMENDEKKREEALTQLESDRKEGSYLLDMSISPANLLKHLDDIDDDEYINGWYVNIVGVSIESETKSTFWGSKESKFYSFILHVKKPGQPGWFIKRRYSEFTQLYKDLKASFPGSRIPDLPSKDKHEVEMNLDDDLNSNSNLKNTVNSAVLHNFDSDMIDIDKESVDSLFANSVDSPKMPLSPSSQSCDYFSDSNAESINSEITGDTNASGSSTGLMKGSKLSVPGFAKPNFLKSPITSPLLSPRKTGNGLSNKNINKVEKSFFNTFKKSAWSSTSSSSSLVSPISTSEDLSNGLGISSSSDNGLHKRDASINSNLSNDSIESTESTKTYHSAHTADNEDLSVGMSKMAVKEDKIVFPREILRQTLRGFLKYVLYINVCAKSAEVAKFLGDESRIAPLTNKDIRDVQRRVNVDHLRTVQHYKFQSALVGIVTVLEKDVENLKTQIYNEGFSYIFARIKHFKTLHELCGYDSNAGSRSWLKTANLLGTTSVLNQDQVEPSNPNDAAAPLRGLVRIILLEIASTQYELLIGSDSAMGTLKTIKRLHSVFPYRLIAGILRFTNPLMMVKRMIDVFTYQMPTVPGMSGGVSAIGNGIGGMMQGLGWSKKKKDADPEKDTFTDDPNHGSNGNSSKKGRSLLQLIFSGMLGEDLRKLEKELIEVHDLLVSHDNTGKEYGAGETIVQRIDKYFQCDDLIVLHIKEMSQSLGIDIPTAILMPNNGLPDCDDLGSETINSILEDYSTVKKAEIEDIIEQKARDSGDKKDDGKDEKKKQEKEKVAETELNSPYNLAKRYFFLQLRKYDKESLMELWNEPELMSVIKEVIALFLSPLIDLFKKAEVYKYVPIFARYIGELIEVCEVYANDYGQFGRSDVVGALVGLEEKYSEDVYRFIRDMYLNDIKSGEESGQGELFEGIVNWLNGVVSFLRFVKKERPDLMIDLNEMLNSMDLSRSDKLNILKVIGEVVAKAEKKRAVLEKMEAEGDLQKLNVERERQHDWMKMARDRKVDGNWDAIHERVFKVGELIAGESEGGIYDVVGLDGVDGTDDFDTDSDADSNEFDDHNENTAKPKTAKTKTKTKFRDYDWNAAEFLAGYYSHDWSRVDRSLLQTAYGGNEFMDGTECGARIAGVFKDRMQAVLAEYGARQHAP